ERVAGEREVEMARVIRDHQEIAVRRHIAAAQHARLYQSVKGDALRAAKRRFAQALERARQGRREWLGEARVRRQAGAVLPWTHGALQIVDSAEVAQLRGTQLALGMSRDMLGQLGHRERV